MVGVICNYSWNSLKESKFDTLP